MLPLPQLQPHRMAERVDDHRAPFAQEGRAEQTEGFGRRIAIAARDRIGGVPAQARPRNRVRCAGFDRVAGDRGANKDAGVGALKSSLPNSIMELNLLDGAPLLRTALSITIESQFLIS